MRRGLAASYGRPFLIGWERAPAPPPGPGCGRGPDQSLRRAELGARRAAAAAQVSFTRGRDAAGGLGWARVYRRPLPSWAPPFLLGVGGQRLHRQDGVSSRTPDSCTLLDSPLSGGHRRGVCISEPYLGHLPRAGLISVF